MLVENWRNVHITWPCSKKPLPADITLLPCKLNFAKFSSTAFQHTFCDSLSFILDLAPILGLVPSISKLVDCCNLHPA